MPDKKILKNEHKKRPHEKEMTPYEIVQRGCKMMGHGMDPTEYYFRLVEACKKPECRVLRANNTLLFIVNNKDGTADGMFFMGDSLHKLIDSFKQFEKAMKVGGFKKVRFGVNRFALIKLAEEAGLNLTYKPTGGGNYGVEVHI